MFNENYTDPVLNSNNHTEKLQSDLHVVSDFPPSPITQADIDESIRQWCAASQVNRFEEAGCAVCGLLKLKTDLSPLKHIKNMLHILEAPGVTRIARNTSDEKIRECRGPVIDKNCNQVCLSCRASIREGKIPKFALCNGLWLGDVPPELQNLTFYEKMLVSRVRHSKCFVRVRKGAANATGHCKLVSNVISFENPTPKIYDVLPPPKEEIEEVLAIMFSGTAQPTDEEYRRSLVFVRRNVVANAIKYCILNHSDYEDVTFSPNNLMGYSETLPIVAIEFFEKQSNRVPEGISVHDNLDDDGNESGECVFTVHGIIGED
ncbi:hypothetical protein EV361DRAFT_812919, partial [Lentinula raphanica]